VKKKAIPVSLRLEQEHLDAVGRYKDRIRRDAGIDITTTDVIKIAITRLDRQSRPLDWRDGPERK